MDSPKKKRDWHEINLTWKGSAVPLEGVETICKKGPLHPALNAYNFLREADPSNPLERPCMAGEEGCLAAQLTNPFTGKSEGLWLREFYRPSIWKKIVELGKLPERRTHCYFCQKYQAAYRYMRLTTTERNLTFNHIQLNVVQEEDYE